MRQTGRVEVSVPPENRCFRGGFFSPRRPEPWDSILCLTCLFSVAPPHHRQGSRTSGHRYGAYRATSPLTAAGLPALPIFRGEAGSSRAEQKVETKFENTMWNKKQEGGFKPLWVKCGCGKWNAVPIGAVVKYFEKILSTPAEIAGKPLPEKSEKRNE